MIVIAINCCEVLKSTVYNSVCDDGELGTPLTGPRLQRRVREGRVGVMSLLNTTLERPITLPESSTYFVKCFAL